MGSHPVIIWSLAVFLWTAVLVLICLGLALLRDWRKR